MTFIEAAKAVLEQEGRPMRSREIAEKAVALGLLSHVGKTPVQTMSARISATVAKAGSPFVRVRPGIFGLTIWKGTPPGPKKADSQKEEKMPPPTDEGKPAKSEPSTAGAAVKETTRQDKKGNASTGDSQDAVRSAPLVQDGTAGTTGRAEVRDSDVTTEQGRGRLAENGATKRRKRKKRKTSHLPASTIETSSNKGPHGSKNDLQNISKSPQSSTREKSTEGVSAPTTAAPSPSDSSRNASNADARSEVRSSTLIGQVEEVLRRNARPIPTERILDAVGLKGEGAPALLEALLASDAAERDRAGQRPRFIKHRSGYALLEREVSAEIITLERQGAELRNRLIQIAEKQLIRKLRTVPMESFIRVMIMYLQRSGFGAMVPVNFNRNGEFHLSLKDRRHQGRFSTGVVLRKDPADFQLRERAVMDLRGALHHYDAMNGMILTTGQVSEKAVHEGRISNLPQVVLVDGETLAREMVELGIGVKVRTLSLPAFDDTFFSNLDL
jgi:hypothetical protein